MSKDKNKSAEQWHPWFAGLLRPLMQDYFEVETNVAVGDVPREADVVLLRRTGSGALPFRGLWRHLTTWNVFEYKGPSVSARLRHLDLLVELGLGIDRRLNEEEERQRRPLISPEQVSFWYIARSMGARFLRDARLRFGQIEELSPGLWRSQVMQRLVFLISSDTFATEPDSVPLHLLMRRSPEAERELAQLILEQPHYWDWYAGALNLFHPEAWKEISNMARARNKGPIAYFRPELDKGGLANLIEEMGIRQIMEKVGPAKIIEEMGVDWLLSKLPPAQLKKLKERLK